MSKKKKKDTSNLALMTSIRRDWNGINPVTRIVESKKNKQPTVWLTACWSQ